MPPSDAPGTPPAPRSFAVPASFIVAGLVGLVVAVAAMGIHFGATRWPRIIPVPSPGPADFAAKAEVVGAFFPHGPGVAIRATPDGPTPLGLFRLDASASKSHGPIRWQVEGPPLTLSTFTPDGAPEHAIAEGIATELGTYHFHATAAGILGGQLLGDTRTRTFTLEAPAPAPAPAPKPDPTPKPDPPKPPAPPAPIAGDGLRVLIVYESSELSKYPKDQLNVLYDQSLRQYLDSATPAVNGTHEYRIFDKDTDVAAEADTWKAAMGRQHPTLPWIVVSNGKTGFEGPLPKDVAGTKALIQKYADAK